MSRCGLLHPISVLRPLSEMRVRNVTAHEPAWSGYLGRVFRIGYSSRQPGLDSVWLVSGDGEYGGSLEFVEFVDQNRIETHFDVLFRTGETGLFEADCPALGVRAGK